MLVTNKFQQKIKIKKLIKKLPTKENLSNGYLKGHFKDNKLVVFEIVLMQIYFLYVNMWE